MNLTATHSSFRNPLASLIRKPIRSSTVYSGIIILALLAFEAFNYSTTAYALKDLLGDLSFVGISWATLMALAFCGIDFAGIARLITQKGRQENPKEAWYLFSAWLVAAAFNATLTWWGVSIAIANHSLTSSKVVATQQLTSIVPVLVAILVWVIRILIIGTLSSALEHANSRHSSTGKQHSAVPSSAGFPVSSRPTAAAAYPRPQSVNHFSKPTTSRVISRPVSNRSTQNDFMSAEQRS